MSTFENETFTEQYSLSNQYFQDRDVQINVSELLEQLFFP
jgi:hypothetical protein